MISTEIVTSTALIVAREGFESLLLTAMITAALPDQQRLTYYINFALTWIVTLFLGWQLVDILTMYVEHMENILRVVSGLVLIYVFSNSKAIFQHAKEHVDELDINSFFMTNVTIFLICLREAAESTVFLRSNVGSNPNSMLIGLAIGGAVTALLLWVSHKWGERHTNSIVFRYIGPALIALGVWYVYQGGTELAEIYGLID